MHDFFLEVNDLKYASWTTNTILFTYLQDIISVLQKRVNKLFTVFDQKTFKQNIDKCHLILCSKVPEKVSNFSVKSKEILLNCQE